MPVVNGVYLADPLSAFVSGYNQAQDTELKIQDTLRGFRDADRQFTFDQYADPYRLSDLRQSLRIRTTQADIAEQLKDPTISAQTAELQSREQIAPLTTEQAVQATQTGDLNVQLKALETNAQRILQGLTLAQGGNLDAFNTELNRQGFNMHVTQILTNPATGKPTIVFSRVDPATGQIVTGSQDAEEFINQVGNNVQGFKERMLATQGMYNVLGNQARNAANGANADALMENLRNSMFR